jgi:hypothetical protein
MTSWAGFWIALGIYMAAVEISMALTDRNLEVRLNRLERYVDDLLDAELEERLENLGPELAEEA